MNPEPFVGIEAASEFLAVKPSWLYEQVRLGKVPSVKVGRFRRFRLSQLEVWATSGSNAAGKSENGREIAS